MTTTITEFIQSIKERLAKVKAWLDFKRPERKRVLRLWKYISDYYDANHDNNKFIVLTVAIKMLILIGQAWVIGFGLIPKFDEVGTWCGGISRVVLIVLFGWLFYAVMRSVFLYKPIRRDRLMFGRSRRDRYGWGMGMYAFITVVIILFYICAVGLIVLQARPYDQVYHSGNLTLRIIWGIMSQFADPGNMPQAVGWGKLVAMMSAFAGILCLSGFVITSLVSMITRRTQYWQRGLIRYERDFKDYVVIIGLNEQTATIVKKSLKHNDVDYVLVQTRRSVEEQRAKLELKLDRADEERVVFYFGERTVYEDICDLRLENAREVYILGEDMESENEQDHDSYNMKCLELISQYCKELSDNNTDMQPSWWGDKLKCHVELEYQSTYTIFKATHIYKRLNQNVEFIPFNVYEIWAKKVLVDNYAVLPGKKNDEHQVQRYLPIDSYRDSATHEIKGITIDSDKSVHLIVVGMNQMGIALAMQAALLVHLPNYHSKGVRTTITFIDEHATLESEYLMGHYEALFALCRHRTINANSPDPIKKWEDENLSVVDPMASANGRYSHLGENFMDIQWEFIEGSTASSCVKEYLIRETNDPQQTCTIAVCHNDPQQSIATALYLPELVQKRVHQVLVYQRNNFDLINKVATGEKQWKRYEKLKPFGMIADCYKGNMFDAVMPKLVLALYRDTFHNIIIPNTRIDAFIDRINRLWSEDGIVYRLSNINVTDCFKSKLRSAGLDEFSSLEDRDSVLNNTELMTAFMAAEHQRWVTERLTMGYRPLDANEMSYFEALAKEKPGQRLSIEGKAKKEYYKDKSRAHLDICSCEMLDQIDPGTKVNDRRIIENLFKLTFYASESKIISRLVLREEQGHEKDENLALAKLFLDEMVVVKGQSSSGAKSTDNVSLPQMWVGKYPVTQDMWKIIMGQDMNPSMCAGPDTERHPVNMVSKEDIDDFLLILNDLTGLRFSLLTKQEWLYAALGGMRAIKKRKTINDLAWNIVTCAKEREKGRDGSTSGQSNKPNTHQVGLKKNNGYGLFDMLGNVWEWTRTRTAAGTYCFCGGSWRYSEKECNLADANESWCSHWTPEHKFDDLGFRLVLYHGFVKNSAPIQKPMDEDIKMVGNIAKNMLYVPSGTFVMGTDQRKVKDGLPNGIRVKTLPDERPAHKVELSAFLISKIPVTQRQYQAIMNDNPSNQKGFDLPVENVSYLDAITFINELNSKCRVLLGLTDDDVVFALPTQAQWEYAAQGLRGDSTTDDFIYSGGTNPDVLAWHFGNTKSIRPIGLKKANALDLYDMCGNVWEWCSDWYQSDYYEQCKRQGAVVDPKGPKSGTTHVLRGGSWRFVAGECRMTRVSHWPEDYRAEDVGFRLVSNVEPDVIEKLLKAVKGKD